MNKSYLLSGKTAKALYKYAKKLSLIDFHNHLSVSDITTDKRFTDIYDLWIKPDPYKHRAMRMCGVPEYYIMVGNNTKSCRKPALFVVKDGTLNGVRYKKNAQKLQCKKNV